MRLTGSRYHLAVLCGWAFRPDVEVEDNVRSEASALGSEAHAYVEAKHLKLDTNALFFSPEAERIGGQVTYWLDEAGIPSACEKKIVYDASTDTAREVDEKKYPGPRNYGPTTLTEIPVTLDLLWLDSDDELTVRDLKTGQKAYAHREQLVIQALASTRLYKRRHANVGFLWGRKTKCDADPVERLDAEALEAAAWEVAAVVTSIPNARPVTGQHCFFCPGRSICPAHQQPTEEERRENA